LLDWHLCWGTRPGGRIDHPGRQWGVKEFASAVRLGDRTIRYWLKDQHLPPEIETIERVLFGRDACYAEWRLELRRARARSQVGKGHGVAPAPTVKVLPASNIPIRVPTHFMGRDEALVDIEAALTRDQGRVAITALHGLRGVGKTTLAAAYAERHRGDYRATWWIRAQTEPSMRADLVALGVRLGWVGTLDEEENALATVMERLSHEGERILLIFDNAINVDAIKLYLPRGGVAKVLITSNAHAWRGVAAPVEIRLWPRKIGADYLILRTGREKERATAEALSEALGGLPLAHEQAAAYCEGLHISVAEYWKRFQASPTRFMDDARHAPIEYHDGMTVAKTFALGIEEAAKQHPASEPLIVHAALLAPEPIPLFLFVDGGKQLRASFKLELTNDVLEEAVGVLLSFALVNCETITDEREPSISTDAIRLHPLVRHVAAGRCAGKARENVRRALIRALATVYPNHYETYNDPKTWSRARRLDGVAFPIVAGDAPPPTRTMKQISKLLSAISAYRFRALGAYAQAQPLYERALTMSEKAWGPSAYMTRAILNELALLFQAQGNLTEAKPLFERVLAANEEVLGFEDHFTVTTRNNLATVLHAQGDLDGARLLLESVLANREKKLGEHTYTAATLDFLAAVLQDQADSAGAVALAERALAMRERVLGPDHLHTAASLNTLARLVRAQGDLPRARALLERALAIHEKVVGPEHPDTATSLDNLGQLIAAQGDLAKALPLLERALAIREKALGPEHPDTVTLRNDLAIRRAQ
jgi:tetratricopeptide (TPR) repeat protein